ncbi:MAG: sulfurylase [Myxococcales bacterium FL481]|nr:MAG: sulfurylase [Myxococcales bacterium FL481]
MSGPLALPTTLLEEIYRHARETFPRECCGYIVGAGDAAKLVRCLNRQDVLHEQDPVTYPRTAETAYQIAGRELLALVRSFDSEEPATVIYHSHPRVGAYFSDEDTRAAVSAGYPVAYLVVDVQDKGIPESRLFERDPDTEPPRYREVARFDGADI